MIEGKNIRLRAAEPSDIDFIFDLENDTSVWRVSNTIAPYSKYQIEQYVLNAHHDLYSEKQLRLIAERKTDEHEWMRIGTVDLYDFEPMHRRAGIGVLIVQSERGKGLAAEVVSKCIGYCFQVLQLHQIFCNIAEGNEQSLKLFTKLGFVFCGKRRDWFFYEDTWVDEIQMQLINK